MTATFKKGDIVQCLEGGPVMTVVDVKRDPGGAMAIHTVLVHGDRTRIEPFRPEQLKVISMDRHEDFDDDSDDEDHRG
jgi:uncharacterized protein YodC (DUF2158 family)